MFNIKKIIQKLSSKWFDLIGYIINGQCGCMRPVMVVWKMPEWSECNNCVQGEYTEQIDLAVFLQDHSYNFKYGLGLTDETAKIIFSLENKEKISDARFFIIAGTKYEPHSKIQPIGFGAENDYYYMILKKCS
jgi:hypothetical protein